MLVNSSAANLIREGKIHQLNNVIAGSAGEGMILLDDSLLELHRQGVVSAADVMVRLQDVEKVKRLRHALEPQPGTEPAAAAEEKAPRRGLLGRRKPAEEPGPETPA
jgi:Tfp pilus assembly ATPase PilU